MHPILFSIGNIHIYSISIALVLAWLVYSFLFWRHLRTNGIAEDKIFDCTFYATLWAFVVARGMYVALHWELFSDSWLQIIAIWTQPGFSLYGAIIGALISSISLSRSLRIRLGHILDAIAMSFPVALIVGLTGVFLDGSVPGKISNLPWALPVVGLVERRHPVALYEILSLILIAILVHRYHDKNVSHKRPYGLTGIMFFIVYSAIMFVLEFAKDTHVYWISLSANQWILIAMFAEALGAFYVRGGGREAVRPLGYKIQNKVRLVVGGIYAKFFKRPVT